MPPAESPPPQSGDTHDQSAIECDACQSALQADGRPAMSFLLLDQLRIPLLSCDDHLEQFSSVCELTTTDTAELLDHQPAGGIRCPGCRRTPNPSAQSLIPIHDGAIVVMACPEHQAEIVQRFQTGLDTHHQLTASLSPTTNSSL